MKRASVFAILLLSASGGYFLVSTVGILPQAVALAAPQRGGRGSLTGVVLGPDDKPVAHASVGYQSSAGLAPHAVLTDAHGRFFISKLKSDNYDLRASHKGIFSEWEKNITVRSGRTTEVTLRLIYAREIVKSTPHAPKSQKP